MFGAEGLAEPTALIGACTLVAGTLNLRYVQRAGAHRVFVAAMAAVSCAMTGARLTERHGKRTEARRAAGTGQAAANPTDAEGDRRGARPGPDALR
jgi:hypothetical protein